MATIERSTEATWSHAISKDNHGPLVSITVSLMLVGMILCLGIRMAIRWPWRQLLGLDDIMTIVASFLAVGQSIATFEAVHYGLGKHRTALDSERLSSMEKAIYAGDILFILALAGSKMAISLLLLRLSSSKRFLLAARIITAVIGLWGFAAVLAVSIRPGTSHPWQPTARTGFPMANAWIGVGATSIALEAILLIFPILLVWELQMPRASKLTVILGFAFRIPVSIITILRLVTLHNVIGQGSDISWSYIVLVIYIEIEMHYSLIAATIPCMRIFLKNFTTGYLGTTADQVDPTASGNATKGDNSYMLSSMRSRHLDPNSKTPAETHGRERGLKLRPDGGTMTSHVVHPDHATDTGSISSDRSDKIIIRKTVHVDWGQSET